MRAAFGGVYGRFEDSFWAHKIIQHAMDLPHNLEVFCIISREPSARAYG